MAVDDVYVLTVTATTTAGINQNSLAFTATTETAPTAAIFAPIAVAMKDLHRFNQNTGIHYVGWKARQVRGDEVDYPTGADCSPIGGNYFEGIFTTNLDGVVGGDLLPPQCALVTTIKTGTIGRRHRGRFYAGAFSEADQVGGVWSPTLLTAIGGQWTTFFTTYAVPSPSSGMRLGVWSVRTATGCGQTKANPVHHRIDPPNEDEAFTPATSSVTRATVYTQRRRVSGMGL